MWLKQKKSKLHLETSWKEKENKIGIKEATLQEWRWQAERSLFFTAICWRLRIDKICTYTCFVDISAFVDTIIPELVADQLIEENVNLQTVHFIL